MSILSSPETSNKLPPGVSIYIPTRNRAALLARALRSVFAQTYHHFEVLVVDDNSTDGTSNLLKNFAHESRLRWFRFDSARGAQAARNRAISEARFDLLTGLDDDDEWLPDRLRQMVNSLCVNVGFVAATDVVILNNGIHHLARRPHRISATDLLYRNVVGNQVLARRADFIDCGLFDETLPASQDYDLWIRLAAQAGIGVGLQAPLQVIHAQADRHRITTSRRRRTGLWRVYKKHKACMTRAQRKSHLFNLIRTTNRDLPLRAALALVSRRDAWRILAHMLRKHGLLPDTWIERVASFRDRKLVEATLKLLPPLSDGEPD